MKHIITFFCAGYPEPTKGGISAVTYTLAREFARRGHTCYCVYSGHEADEGEQGKNPFTKTLLAGFTPSNRENVSQLLKHTGTSIVINQHPHLHVVSDFLGADALGSGAKIFSVFHWMPGWETAGMAGAFRFIYSGEAKEHYGLLQRFAARIKTAVLPLYMRYARGSAIANYRRVLRNSQHLVTLSSRSAEGFIRHYNVPAKLQSKVITIPNPLRFETADSNVLTDKENIVLIVSRLEERMKRISLALKIWATITGHFATFDAVNRADANPGGQRDYKQGCGEAEDRDEVKDKLSGNWKLVIVGYGRDKHVYEAMARRMGLCSVEFMGKADPLEYYRRASLYITTSLSEGFGMTLTEAMSQGTVPVAFDCFDSVGDIIDNDVNGFIVHEGDSEGYVSTLSALMSNANRREEAAMNALEKSRAFSAPAIASIWEELFSQSL